MKKRIISSVLAAALLLASLSACQQAPAGSAASGDASSPAADSSQGAGEESGKKFDDVKLKMLFCWDGGIKTAADQYNNDVAAAIREKTGVTVELEGIMMNEAEKLNLIFASGDMPDMIHAPYWGGESGETQVIKKAAREGRLQDIAKLVPEYKNISDAYNDGVISARYRENDIDLPEYNGARYVLPTQVPGDDNGLTNWAYGVFVRGDVPKALGVDEKSIKTSDQLYDFMVKARDKGFQDVNGNDAIVATTYHDAWDYTGFITSFTDKRLTEFVKQPDGKVTHLFLTDDYVDKNLFIWKMVNQNILDKECFKQTDAQADEKVGNGTALFVSVQYQFVVNATKLTGLYNTNPEMRYVPVGPLTYKDGSPLVQAETYGRTGSPVFIFPTSCKNLDAALSWIDYVNSEEGARLIQYGFEGDTYEMNDKGQPRMNAELTKRFAEDAEAVKAELRERGIGYMAEPANIADKRFTWWGEQNAFDADALAPEIKDYREARPIERIKGYPISGLVAGFEKYDEVKEFAFEGSTEIDFRERAYFAETEEEARALLKEYQNYLSTQKNGLFMEFLDYVATLDKARDNIVY